MLRTILIKKLLLATLFLVGILNASAQFRSGLILGGGIGSISNVDLSHNDIMGEIIQANGTGSVDYKFNAAVGYKFRFEPQAKPFFYDVDMYVGMKKYTYEYFAKSMPDDPIPYFYGNSGDINLLYTSLHLSWNYKINKGLYAGAGIAPLFYFNKETAKKFDASLLTKIGYDFKFIEIAAGYNVGLFNTLKPEYFASGRLNDWQIQLFIPF